MSQKAATRILLLLAAAWLALVAVANPTGEFPLNDDWIFGRAVYSLTEEGRIAVPPGAVVMTLIIQMLWGALFCVPFGFSFLALRSSTIVAGLGGIFATYALLRQAKVRRDIALLGTATLAFNPLYFNLSNTFMTDVPFYTLAMLAAVWYLRALESGSRSDIWIGVLWGIAATLIRQVGVLIPVAWGAAQLYRGRRNWRAWMTAAGPALITLGVLIFYQGLIAPQLGMHSFKNPRVGHIAVNLLKGSPEVIHELLDQALIIIIYLGFFLTPIWIFAAFRLYGNGGWKKPWVLGSGAASAALLTLGLLNRPDWTMPLGRNVLYDLGLGPPTLRDVYLLKIPNLWQAPEALWAAVTILAIVGGMIILQTTGFLIASTIRDFRLKPRESGPATAVMALAACGIYFALLISGGFFDRYLIFFLPFVILLMTASQECANFTALVRMRRVAAAFLLILAAFAAAGTHDYLAWNRARWAAANTLLARGVPASHIDGGFEFNGWHNYRPSYQRSPDKSWWWVESDEYLVTFGPVEGYATVAKQPYNAWLTPGEEHIFTLQKRPPRASLSPNNTP